jgi:hypothetical protein
MVYINNPTGTAHRTILTCRQIAIANTQKNSDQATAITNRSRGSGVTSSSSNNSSCRNRLTDRQILTNPTSKTPHPMRVTLLGLVS